MYHKPRYFNLENGIVFKPVHASEDGDKMIEISIYKVRLRGKSTNYFLLVILKKLHS